MLQKDKNKLPNQIGEEIKGSINVTLLSDLFDNSEMAVYLYDFLKDSFSFANHIFKEHFSIIDIDKFKYSSFEEQFAASNKLSEILISSNDSVEAKQNSFFATRNLFQQSGATTNYFREQLTIFLANDNSPMYVFSMVENINSEKNVNRKLVDTEKKFQALLNVSNEGFFEWDIATNSFSLSDSWYKLFGSTPYYIPSGYNHWLNMVHSEDYRLVKSKFDEIIKGESAFLECQYRMKNSKGIYIWVESRLIVIEWIDRDIPKRAIGTTRDISLSKQDLSKNNSNSEYLRLIMKNSSDGIVILDEDGIIIEWSDTQEKISGIPGGLTLGKQIASLKADILFDENDDYDSIYEQELAAFNEYVRTGNSFWLSGRSGGSFLPQNNKKTLSSEYFRFADNGKSKTLILTKDRSELEQSNKELQADEQLITEIFEYSGIGIYKINLETLHYEFFNSEFNKLIGEDTTLTHRNAFNIFLYSLDPAGKAIFEQIESLIENLKESDDYGKLLFYGINQKNGKNFNVKDKVKLHYSSGTPYLLGFISKI